MRISDQAQAAARAQHALATLEQHPAASRNELGTARDLLNTTRNHHDPATVRAALTALEDLTVKVDDRQTRSQPRSQPR